ncbi:hypothetical protein A9Z42_0086220 [Trichoderma parareesei]|uniref:Uncharacterized protein n=1 Tax=Trichoderma parareesei TaxID=858221 RepID=A0A2H3A4V8_TRIPA|nr:hypothetical protein A9Z42_0086220 [Trichoderma parareesei]
MSFLAQVRDSLASAQLEISRHVNAAGIHRVLEDAQTSVQAGAAGISHLRHLATGYEAQATMKQLGSTDNATAGQDDCSHVEITMTGDEQGTSKAKSAFPSADTTGEKCTCRCSCDDGPQSSKTNQDGAHNGFMDGARRVSVRVTPSSVAAGIQAGIGSVGAGGIFAMVQSAAMGGYGAAVLTGATQAAGVTMAGAGGLATFMGRKQKCEQSSEGPSGEKPSEEKY